MAREVVWPALPDAVDAPLGPVRVRRAAAPLTTPDGDRCGGYFWGDNREIVIEACRQPENEWRVFWHEWTHAVLTDLDVVLPDGPDYHNSPEERVCNAIALARVQEMRAALPTALPAPARKHTGRTRRGR
jgi:hypothetical protein